MALPQINETVTFKLTIPSTGKKIEFRPYLVAEEKVLLIAYESQDPKQIMSAMKNTISACCIGDITPDNLTTFDLEYIFTRLRCKSVGESSTILMACDNMLEDGICEHKNEVTIDLAKVEVGVQQDKDIRLTNNYTAVMRYPSLKMAESLIVNEEEDTSVVATNFESVAKCIVGVKDNDEFYDFSDYSLEEIIAWMDKLKSEQIKLLFKFLDTTPSVKVDAEFTCEKCGATNKRVLEGIDSFF